MPMIQKSMKKADCSKMEHSKMDMKDLVAVAMMKKWNKDEHKNH